MSLIGSIGNLSSHFINRTPTAARPEGLSNSESLSGLAHTGQSGKTSQVSGDFGKAFESMINAVDAKQDEAQAVTKSVLMGESDQLHQSVIAMQEAGVAFQFMVEVRNKLVESYQELMRMPV